MNLNRAKLGTTSSGKPEASFRLRDYLTPNGKYPYNDLPNDLESALNAGYTVYLFSVPGFMMLAGHPDADKPWHTTDYGDKYFKTAKQALKS